MKRLMQVLTVLNTFGEVGMKRRQVWLQETLPLESTGLLLPVLVGETRWRKRSIAGTSCRPRWPEGTRGNPGVLTDISAGTRDESTSGSGATS